MVLEELVCTSIQKLALFQNTGDDYSFSSTMDTMASIISFDVTLPTTKSTKSMFLPGGGIQVYSSPKRLVLAVQGWWVDDGAKQETYLIGYGYNGASTIGQSLGTVTGYVLNQFSLDHMKQNNVDYLRVATSTQSRWIENENGIWESTHDSTSQITVLEFNDGSAGDMPVVGLLTGLGKPGEQIFSVCFMGEKAYVVTFKQTDPFYTVDLSDPTNPTAVGELVIPGFSSYLHPAGENLIIGVGQAADANGTTTGLQISLFDVSDFANPARVQNFEVSTSSKTSSSSSEAQYDHMAFRYLLENKLLIIPVSHWEYTAVQCPIYNGTEPMPLPAAEGDSGTTTTTMSVSTKQAAEGDAIAIDVIPSICYNTTGGFDGFRLYSIDATAGISEYFSIEHFRWE